MTINVLFNNSETMMNGKKKKSLHKMTNADNEGKYKLCKNPVNKLFQFEIKLTEFPNFFKIFDKEVYL